MNHPLLPTDMDSTATSEQLKDKPFHPSTPSQRLPHWLTHHYPHGEPNLVNGPPETLSETSLSSLPTTLSLPSTPSISSIPQFKTFPPGLQRRLNNRYQKI